MYTSDDIIDSSYRVTGICSDQGGMGVVLHVESLVDSVDFPLVLKYCRASEDEYIKRFRREVRLLGTFRGNGKVVQIHDENMSHDPPYFVMKFYPDGDLITQAESIQKSLEIQEEFFLKMIECIQQLHARNEFHRDIKPQNFLVDGNNIVVSDFGLTTQIGSSTAFTRSSMSWGTHGYIPPEFLTGGFRNADAAGDIFMLGKSFYELLTGRNPLYLESDNIPPPVFNVIERCCAVAKDQRYQSLAELQQSLVATYDVLLKRSGGVGKARQLLSSINDRLEQDRKYKSSEIQKFIEQLSMLEEGDQIQICREACAGIFEALGRAPSASTLDKFLEIYEKLVEKQDYSWSYAEVIASNMKSIFNGADVTFKQKAKALDLAIRAANYMNRFAAMDTCKSLITSVTDDELGLQIATVIRQYRGGFLDNIEPSECSSEVIRSALRQIQEKNGP